jgi:hypothetical protein
VNLFIILDHYILSIVSYYLPGLSWLHGHVHITKCVYGPDRLRVYAMKMHGSSQPLSLTMPGMSLPGGHTIVLPSWYRTDTTFTAINVDCGAKMVNTDSHVTCEHWAICLHGTVSVFLAIPCHRLHLKNVHIDSVIDSQHIQMCSWHARGVAQWNMITTVL